MAPTKTPKAFLVSKLTTYFEGDFKQDFNSIKYFGVFGLQPISFGVKRSLLNIGIQREFFAYAKSHLKKGVLGSIKVKVPN